MSYKYNVGDVVIIVNAGADFSGSKWPESYLPILGTKQSIIRRYQESNGQMWYEFNIGGDTYCFTEVELGVAAINTTLLTGGNI